MAIEFTPHDEMLLLKERAEARFGSDPHHHLARARFLLSVDTGLMPVSALFYASLEYRFCIERFLFSILSLVSGEDAVTRAHEKMYTGSDLSNAIRRIEPELMDKLRYVDLVLRAHDRAQVTAKPDLDRLSRLHGRLGGYLHAQKRPPETTWSPDWLAEFKEILQECDKYLGEVLAIDKVLAGMPNGDLGYDKWKSGAISDEEVVAAIRKRR
jgi:hypothetical protein